MLEHGLVTEEVLFLCLDCVRSLQAKLSHGSLHVDRTLLLEFVDTVVDNAKSPAASDSSTAVNYDLLVGGRLFGSRLCISDGMDEIEDCLATGGDPIVRPG